MTWMLSRAKAKRLLPTGMMLVWMMWRRKSIHEIFSGGIDPKTEKFRYKFFYEIHHFQPIEQK